MNEYMIISIYQTVHYRNDYLGVVCGVVREEL